uniref:hypothetical protein n=1 Tax=Bartonella doshiae TaxID=33044 RepID=UPI001ABB9795
MTGKPDQNENLRGIDARSASSIELLNTNIKNTNKDAELYSGIQIWHGSTLKMTGGSVAAQFAIILDTDDSGKTILENVKLWSGKDNKKMINAISVHEGTVNLKNLTVDKATYTVKTTSDAKVIISGGSFGGTIFNFGQNSTITLNDKVTVTSDEYGLRAGEEKSKIIMTGGSVKGEKSALYSENGGKINVTDVAITTEGNGFGVQALNSNSTIELNGNTTIKNASVGVKAKGGSATIKMTGGSIEASIGAAFHDTKSTDNKLENVKISSSKDNTLMEKGISVDVNSKVILKNVTVTQATKGISIAGHSQITISGGSFSGKTHGIHTRNSIITLNDNAVVTSDGNALHVEGEQSKITMTGGSVKGKTSALYVDAEGQIDISKATLTTDGTGTGAKSIGQNSMIDLHDNTTIKEAAIGLEAKDNGVIQMTGGSITVSKTGASFKNSKSDKNKLENVVITSSSNDKPITTGVSADKKSTVALKNITVKNAEKALFANDNSQISVTGGGSFGGEVQAKQGSTISLDDNVTVTSENDGLHADGEKAKITMTGGTVKGQKSALLTENAGYIDVTDITLTADDKGTGAKSIGQNSMIDLHDNTTIKEAVIGLEAKDNGTISMRAGSITASQTGVSANKKSSVTLDNVTITQTQSGIFANEESQITISGGSFEAEKDTVYAKQGSTITLENDAKAISSDGNALRAEGNQSKITMTGGNVKGKTSALYVDAEGQIDISKATLTTDGTGTGAKSIGQNSIIDLHDNTTIKEAVIGLEAKDNGTISMRAGSITASHTGASFSNSKNEQNKLENVVIASSSNDKPITTGVSADNKSTVALKNITVKNAEKALFANDNSQISVTGGGSFGGEVQAKQGSTISLDDNVTVTSENDGLHADGEKAKITMTGGTVKGQKSALLTENAGYIDVTDITLTADDKGTGAKSIGQNSIIDLHDNTTIKEAVIGLEAKDNGTISMRAGSITASHTGASFSNSKNEQNKLENVVIASGKDSTLMETGVSANKKSSVTLDNVTITQTQSGIFANEESQITISGGSFEAEKDTVYAKQGSTITLENDAKATSSDGNALRAEGNQSKITMTGGSVNAKETAFVVKDGGKIDGTNITARAENKGIKFDDTQNDQTSEINLNNTKLFAKNGTGIVASSSSGKLNLKDSEIHADRLFMGITHDAPQHDETFTLSAENSLLQGGVKNDENGRTTFDLKNDTTWFLKTSTQEKDQNGDLLDIAQRSRSNVSVLNLNDSKIVFRKPVENHYHTLHIGSGKKDTPEVYNASGNAAVHFNMAWSDGVAVDDQKTDRILIHGDASGTTTIYIKSDVGDISSVENAGSPSNTGGISLIQVSGKATEDSFKLANGYITRDGSPYKYTLTAYGPTSSYGVANETQNLFEEKNENFWDFRLHKAFLDTNPNIPDVLPQVSSYLALPNALFYAGFIDMAKQSASLANARKTAMGIQDNDKIKGFFLSSYGSIATLSSQQYAYNTNIRYAATQAGFTASAQDGQNTIIYWGLTGTYAQLSLSPKDIEDSEKSTLDKWSVTAYSGIEHNS